MEFLRHKSLRRYVACITLLLLVTVGFVSPAMAVEMHVPMAHDMAVAGEQGGAAHAMAGHGMANHDMAAQPGMAQAADRSGHLSCCKSDGDHKCHGGGCCNTMPCASADVEHLSLHSVQPLFLPRSAYRVALAADIRPPIAG